MENNLLLKQKKSWKTLYASKICPVQEADVL